MTAKIILIWLLAQAVALAVMLPICKMGKRSDEE